VVRRRRLFSDDITKEKPDALSWLGVIKSFAGDVKEEGVKEEAEAFMLRYFKRSEIPMKYVHKCSGWKKDYIFLLRMSGCALHAARRRAKGGAARSTTTTTEAARRRTLAGRCSNAAVFKTCF
jgi:hypothetical protein